MKINNNSMRDKLHRLEVGQRVPHGYPAISSSWPKLSCLLNYVHRTDPNGRKYAIRTRTIERIK